MIAPRPRLRRAEASIYLLDTHGVPCSRSTLEKLATNGGGPAITYFGRIPLYGIEDLDNWARQKLEQPVTSTAERIAGG